MKKAIVKMKLPSRNDFIIALGEIDYKFSDPYWQHDRIFVSKHYDRDKSQPRLSLRTMVKNPGKSAIYGLVLRRHFADKSLDIVNTTQVKDYAETAQILYQLGYELKYEVSRRREELIMSDTLRIFIDKIDNLPGYYAKIESDLDDSDDAAFAYDDLVETFKVLKVNAAPVKKTYGELLESSKHSTTGEVPHAL